MLLVVYSKLSYIIYCSNVFNTLYIALPIQLRSILKNVLILHGIISYTPAEIEVGMLGSPYNSSVSKKFLEWNYFVQCLMIGNTVGVDWFDGWCQEVCRANFLHGCLWIVKKFGTRYQV